MIKYENKFRPLIQALKNKTLSEELQDYKVKSVKGLQDYICLREGLQDYKSLSEGKGELSWTLVLNQENWTLILDPKIGPIFCLKSLSIYR